MAGQPPSRPEELARRIRAGDSAAEEELATLVYPQVMALAAERLRDREAAREIAQETLLAVLPTLRNGGLQDPSKVIPFVLSAARNVVNNHLRKLYRHPEPGTLSEDTAGAISPSFSSDHNEQKALIRDFLSHLRREDGRILFLTLTEGMNPREIAPLLGLKPEVVRTRKSRAIKQIIKRMKIVLRKSPADHQLSGRNRNGM